MQKHNLLHSDAIENTEYQILYLEFVSINITLVYISSSAKSYSDVSETLKGLINSRKTSVVCGDFNFNFYKSPDNVISNTLHEIGFQQVISDSTHIEGSLLDHIYTNIEPQSQFIHPVYFSDHDATCLILRI